ncbi:MAG: GTP-binding protein [Opitutales bacterium]|nr:GTP-binding protein [Opitutales bacterium]
MPSKKIPVILVTGFLGSGKTTLLRRLAEMHRDWRMVFLVNEFAKTDIDGEKLAATGSKTLSVVGGSLFCECKAGDFLKIMQEEVLGCHRTSPLDAVLIETSGTANPEAIGQLMANHGLASNFELRSIVTVVAPAKLPKLMGNLPVVEAQLRSSDLIVINKTDTVAAATLDCIETTIRQRNAEANIVRAEFCKFDFFLPEKRPVAPSNDLSTCEANPFTTAEVEWPKDRPLNEARAWLASLPETILRIKGRIRTPEGDWHVERTVDSLNIEPAPPGPTRLVLIAHDDDEKDLFSILRPS